MGLSLTDGYEGKPHICAEHIGYYNVGMFGYETGYFTYDYMGNFETEILSGNKVRIKNGMGILGGRRFTIFGTEDVAFENGATGQKRIDTIHLKHTQAEDGVESLTFEVFKGVPVTSGNPVPKVHSSTGPIPNIAGDYLKPMFLVEFDGVNIISVEKHEDFSHIPSAMELFNEKVSKRYVDGSIISWTPALFGKDEGGNKYAGAYVNRTATKKIIAGRCYLDINIAISSLGTLGTGDLTLGIMGISSGNIPKAKSSGLVYSAAVSYVTGAGLNNDKIRASIASGNDCITLLVGGNYLKAKDITADFQIRLSVNYDIA